jgi:hypothetical protein
VDTKEIKEAKKRFMEYQLALSDGGLLNQQEKNLRSNIMLNQTLKERNKITQDMLLRGLFRVEVSAYRGTVYRLQLGDKTLFEFFRNSTANYTPENTGNFFAVRLIETVFSEHPNLHETLAKGYGIFEFMVDKSTSGHSTSFGPDAWKSEAFRQAMMLKLQERQET